jgi:hypothetical protein
MTDDETTDETGFEDAAEIAESADSLRHDVLLDAEEIGNEINTVEQDLDELRAMAADVRERAQDLEGAAEHGLYHVRDGLGTEHDVLTEDVAQLGRLTEDLRSFFDSLDADDVEESGAVGDVGTVEIDGQEYEAEITLTPVEDDEGGEDGLDDLFS